MVEKLTLFFLALGIGSLSGAISSYFLSLLPISTSRWERRQSRIFFSLSLASFLASVEIVWGVTSTFIHFFSSFRRAAAIFFFFIFVSLPFAPLLVAKLLGWDEPSPPALTEEALALSAITHLADSWPLSQKRVLLLSYAASATGSLVTSIIFSVLWRQWFPSGASWIYLLLALFLLVIFFLQAGRVYGLCRKWLSK